MRILDDQKKGEHFIRRENVKNCNAINHYNIISVSLLQWICVNATLKLPHRSAPYVAYRKKKCY